MLERVRAALAGGDRAALCALVAASNLPPQVRVLAQVTIRNLSGDQLAALTATLQGGIDLLAAGQRAELLQWAHANGIPAAFVEGLAARWGDSGTAAE